MITLITGGAQGIGFAIAERLAIQGGKLCLFDLNGAEQAAAKLGSDQAIGFDGDVTSDLDVDAAITKAIDTFGGLDCLVAAAGIVRVEPALDVDPSNFERTLSVNVTGSFLAAQRSARYMAENSGGSIVFLGSVYGEGGAPERTSYCASKGAVHNMTRALAVEWGPLGIRVNAVAPTGVRTPMVQNLIDNGQYNMVGVQNRTPLGRLAEPSEVASAIAYLASPEASMVNGVILPVDGGWTANGYTVG